VSAHHATVHARNVPTEPPANANPARPDTHSTDQSAQTIAEPDNIAPRESAPNAQLLAPTAQIIASAHHAQQAQPSKAPPARPPATPDITTTTECAVLVLLDATPVGSIKDPLLAQFAQKATFSIRSKDLVCQDALKADSWLKESAPHARPHANPARLQIAASHAPPIFSSTRREPASQNALMVTSTMLLHRNVRHATPHAQLALAPLHRPA
jgi:hypothetical protein